MNEQVVWRLSVATHKRDPDRDRWGQPITLCGVSLADMEPLVGESTCGRCTKVERQRTRQPSEWALRAFNLRASGMTFKQVAEEMHVTIGRVRVLEQRVRRIQYYHARAAEREAR